MEIMRPERWIRRCLFTGLLLGVLSAPATASANDHFIKIREVFAGTPGAPSVQFVELQMFAANQITLGGNEVHVYDDNDVIVGTFTFPVNVANGASQASVLVATSQAATFFGVTPDLTMMPTVPSGAGGKVCYEDADGAATMGIRDCVSFGPFLGDPNGDDGLTGTEPTMRDDVGNPFGPIEGIEPGHAILRDISANNPALLEAADDSGDSAADFDEAAAPTPRNNAGATTATAGSTAVAGGTLDFNAAAGVANRIKVSVPTTGTVALNDAAAPVTAGAGCSQFHVNEVRCPLVAGSTVDLSLGDLIDTVTGPNRYKLDVDAGTGNDRITTRNGADHLIGGDGNDTLNPGKGADVVDGGTGVDTATYALRTAAEPVAVDIDGNPDDGNLDDGPPGARDNVLLTVERLVGGVADDVLVGSNTANKITGGPGGDTIQGLSGNDMLLSGSVASGAGDGLVDNILCGLGAADHVFANTGEGDTFPTSGPENCELVN